MPKKQKRQRGQSQPRLQSPRTDEKQKQAHPDESPPPRGRTHRRRFQFIARVPDQKRDDQRDEFRVLVICFGGPRLPRPDRCREMATREKFHETKKINERRGERGDEQRRARFTRRPIAEGIPPRLVRRGRLRLAHLSRDVNLPPAETQEMDDAIKAR